MLQQGFSLIEVLIAMALITVVSLSTYHYHITTSVENKALTDIQLNLLKSDNDFDKEFIRGDIELEE